MYIAWSAYKYFVANRKFYILFILQIIFITCVINIILGMRSGLRQEMNQYSNQRQFDVIYPAIEDDYTGLFNKVLIESYPSIQQVSDRIPTGLVTKWHIGIQTDDTSIKSYNYYEVLGDFESLALSKDIGLDTEQYIYAPHSFFEDLKYSIENFPEFISFQGYNFKNVSLKDGYVELSTGNKIPIFPTDDLKGFENVEIIFGNHIHLDNLDEETHFLMNSVITSSKWNILNDSLVSASLGFRINANQINEFKEINSILENGYGNRIRYFSLNKLLKDKVDEVLLISRTLMLVLFICTIIVTVGLIGLISTFIDRRKANISLCGLIGATQSQLILELMIEILIVFISSGIIGVLLSHVFAYFNPILLGVKLNIQFIHGSIILIMEFLISIVITLILGRKHTSMNPIKVLNEE